MENDHFFGNVSLSEPLATLLDRLKSGGTSLSIDPGVGPLLYLLADATRPAQLLEVGAKAGYATLWLAAVAQRHNSALGVQVASGREELEQMLQEAAVSIPLQLQEEFKPASAAPVDFMLLHLDAADLNHFPTDLVPSLSSHALLVAHSLKKERIERLEEQVSIEPLWRTVIAHSQDGAPLWIASRPEREAQYEESAREAFIALFLHAVQPANLLLGPNVVFDGTIKPPGTKIQFSGMGGELASGDLLLVHPEDLQRYSPDPGAVALVLGEPVGSVRAPHVSLQLGGETVTLIVA